jgi:hypothetical protein
VALVHSPCGDTATRIISFNKECSFFFQCWGFEDNLLDDNWVASCWGPQVQVFFYLNNITMHYLYIWNFPCSLLFENMLSRNFFLFLVISGTKTCFMCKQCCDIFLGPRDWKTSHFPKHVTVTASHLIMFLLNMLKKHEATIHALCSMKL